MYRESAFVTPDTIFLADKYADLAAKSREKMANNRCKHSIESINTEAIKLIPSILKEAEKCAKAGKTELLWSRSSFLGLKDYCVHICLANEICRLLNKEKFRCSPSLIRRW